MNLFPLRAWCVAAGCLLGPGAAAAQTAVVEVRVATADGAPLTGATVTLQPRAGGAAARREVSDTLGRARFPGVPHGTWLIAAERLGYETVAASVLVGADSTHVVELVARERAVGLPRVLVEAERRRSRLDDAAGATTSELTQRDLKLLPALGEADVLRAMEVLPGVVSTSDFSSSFNVRGGAADQNLILLDGLPIYNPFHLGGVFSVFNADMVSRAELLSGGFPARYGGRVSSVLQVESAAGGPDTDVQAGVSLLATRVSAGVDLPDRLLAALAAREGRVRVSFRRSYFDQLLKPFFNFPYHLTDVQLYSEAVLENGGRLALTGYTGEDVLDLVGLESFPLRVHWDWGNAVLGGTWSRPVGGGRLLEVRVGHTRFGTSLDFPEFGDTEFRSRIRQNLVRAELSTAAGRWPWEAGVALDRVSYDYLAASAGTVFAVNGAAGWLAGGYTQGSWRAPRWVVEAGVRADAWIPGGDATEAVLQPRVAVKRFLGRSDHALRFAIGRYAQFAHSLRDEELPLGLDVWVLSGARAPVIVSDQVQAGAEMFFGDWSAGVDTYYRHFDGVATNNFAEDPNDPRDDLLAGTGASYGADLQLARGTGDLRPMVSISWLKTWREFPDPASGVAPRPAVRYPPIFDRRVDIDAVLQARVRGFDLGARWSFGTGLPYTRPVGSYTYYQYSVLDNTWRPLSQGPDTTTPGIVLARRNSQRYPVYHRLDLAVRRTFRKRWGTLTPSFDVINVYNRRNVLFYFYQYDDEPPTRAGLSMFPLLPTAGIEVRF